METTVPRYISLVLGTLLVTSLAGAAGYYLGRHRADTEYLGLMKLGIAGYKLEDGTYDVLMMRLLAEGRTEDAYTLAEGRTLTAFQYFHYWPPFNDQQAQRSRTFTANVVEFYKHYPERRKALAEHGYRPPDLLQWIDGGL